MSDFGSSGGIVFHARRSVSLTISSASSSLARMFLAIVSQYLPYLSSHSRRARSSRAKNSSIIFRSSLLFSFLSRTNSLRLMMAPHPIRREIFGVLTRFLKICLVFRIFYSESLKSLSPSVHISLKLLSVRDNDRSFGTASHSSSVPPKRITSSESH